MTAMRETHLYTFRSRSGFFMLLLPIYSDLQWICMELTLFDVKLGRQVKVECGVKKNSFSILM